MGESFLSIFTGSSQSRYAGFAIMLSVIVVSLVILFGKDSVPLSQKFSFVLLIFLISLPAILMTLFQLTCLVRGTGANNERWWCGVYAWIISIVLILYCTLLVFVAVTALITGEKVLQDISDNDVQEFQRNNDTATAIVQEYFSTKYIQDEQASATNYSQGVVMDPTEESPNFLTQMQNQDALQQLQLIDTPAEVPISPELRQHILEQIVAKNGASSLEQHSPEEINKIVQLAAQSSMNIPPQHMSSQMANILNNSNKQMDMGNKLNQIVLPPTGSQHSPQMNQILAQNGPSQANIYKTVEKFNTYGNKSLPAPTYENAYGNQM
jgi:uncharacterized membrane protein